MRGPWTRRDGIAVIVAVSAGVALAIIDSRPAFDDAGVTAVGLALAAGLAAFVSGRRPWLWSVAAGIRVPLVELRDLANGGPLLALAACATGAAAGWFAARRVT